MYEHLKQKDISTLLEEHCVFALIFHLWGVNVFNHLEKSFCEICSEKELEADKLIENYRSLTRSHKKRILDLDKIPLEVVIDYVKTQHGVIRFRKLPFLDTLIQKLKNKNRHLEKVKDFFPAFRRGLEAHIAQEEREMLPHIVFLMNNAMQRNGLFEVYSILENESMEKYTEMHEQDERDELFHLLEAARRAHEAMQADVQLKILVNELTNFNHLLKALARIENRILLPKAKKLEMAISEELQQIATLN